MNRSITSAHNYLAHLVQNAFGLKWKQAFSWAGRASSDESVVWAQRRDSVFGCWCIPTVESVHRHMKALAQGYSVMGDTYRARTFSRFAARLEERLRAERGVEFAEVMALGGVGSGVLEEVLDFYRCATQGEARSTTPRARKLALALNERVERGVGERVWQMALRDDLMRPAYWRHLAVYGGGLQGGEF